MQKGIELFKHGSNSSQINFREEISEFILKNPLFYLEFLKLIYNINLNRIEFNIKYIKEGEIFKPLQIVYHGDIEKREFITLEYFFIPIQVNSFVDNNGLRYLAIAASEDSGKGGILVGVDKINIDKIYKYRWEESDLQSGEVKLLSENIFDFINDLKSLEMWEIEYNRDKLYKLYYNSYYQMS